jgi:hypothetical protein
MGWRVRGTCDEFQTRKACKLAEKLLAERWVATEESLDMVELKLGELSNSFDASLDEFLRLGRANTFNLEQFHVIALPHAGVDASKNIESRNYPVTVESLTKNIDKTSKNLIKDPVYTTTLRMELLPGRR